MNSHCGRIIATVSEARPMIGALLSKADSIALAGGTLDACFGPDANGLLRLLDAFDNRRCVEDAASKIVGHPVKLLLNGKGHSSGPDHLGLGRRVQHYDRRRPLRFGEHRYVETHTRREVANASLRTTIDMAIGEHGADSAVVTAMLRSARKRDKA